ncbi:MAG: transposase [Rubripirellula sp.]
MVAGQAVTGLESEQQLNVANLIRQFAPQYVQNYPSQAVPQVQSTLAKLSLCRTSALGDRHYRCESCHSACKVYNSCGDRHCPQCSGSKRAAWLDSTESLLIAGTSYFQVVFTLPSELSRLALGNRREIYDLLFTASWRSLRETIEDEQGFQAAALMVLHTWNQKLEAHGHVHAVVPAGGPSLGDPDRWKPTMRRGRETPFYLVDVSDLRRRYRDRFIEGLRHIHNRSGLKLEGEFAELKNAAVFESFLKKLASVSWGLNIQPPPQANCESAILLKYLARYLTGGPISSKRLISADETSVRFWAREGKINGGDRQRQSVPMKLSGVEFTRRWSLHILPKGYVRCRRYGGWSNRHRQSFVARCQQLLGDDPIETATAGDLDDDPVEPRHRCSECGAPMLLVAETDKPSWSKVMAGTHRPRWYRESG